MNSLVILPALRASREILIGFTANAVSAQLSFLCCCLKKIALHYKILAR